MCKKEVCAAKIFFQKINLCGCAKIRWIWNIRIRMNKKLRVIVQKCNWMDKIYFTPLFVNRFTDNGTFAQHPLRGEPKIPASNRKLCEHPILASKNLPFLDIIFDAKCLCFITWYNWNCCQENPCHATKLSYIHRKIISWNINR